MGYWGGAGSVARGAAELAEFTRLAATLEPLAVEPVQRGGFTYAIPAGTSKLLLSAWACQLDAAAGRFELREPRPFMPLTDVSVFGSIALPTMPCSVAAFLDPALATYADPVATYFGRLATLAATRPKVLALSAAGGSNTLHTWMAGPYGSLILGLTVFNFTWAAPTVFGDVASAPALPIHDERGDAATDWLRLGRALYFPVHKGMASGFLTGLAGGVGAAAGTLVYYICPASWGAVTDPTTYLFRDDFMGATLDVATVWTRVGAAGNTQIDTALQWLKLIGTGAFGGNGAKGQAGYARVSGRALTADLRVSTMDSQAVVGWNDGVGTAFANLAHEISFTNAAGVPTLYVFEGGVSRGVVGAGYSLNTIYRVRITLTAGGATYEIQGGPEYPALGGATWTNITPGVTASATTPLYPFVASESATPAWVSDVRIV